MATPNSTSRRAWVPPVLWTVRTIVVPRNPAVMHLDGLESAFNDPGHPMVLRLTLSPARFEDLMRRVDQTFELKDGAPFVVNPGHNATDLFFKAAEPASAAHDCNHWIGDVLGRAGFPHNPVLDTASDGLAFDLKSSGRGRDAKASGTPSSAVR
jgi:hypothetical protein